MVIEAQSAILQINPTMKYTISIFSSYKYHLNYYMKPSQLYIILGINNYFFVIREAKIKAITRKCTPNFRQFPCKINL